MTENQNEILIAVTGGIAAYKTCELIRLLVKDGYSVRVLMTENAQQFIGRITFETLSGKPVGIEEYEFGMPHIEMKNRAAVFAVVPATANSIGKLANGIADGLLGSTYLALQCPTIIAPAMNPAMYFHPAVQRNLKTLKEDGALIVEPEEGIVACGDFGPGKLADVEKIKKAILSKYPKK
ncbi:MAG: phosphopantothenoylcysteine decarboxylase [Leptospiraceae bacterium]|nr:phosphopantothenoylcysteine decarboxylase [Leptospiraceae bacterium]MCP5498406.1 phosphopantothenoylcysteine decarboxylase [Leptospiraceae bacterium]